MSGTILVDTSFGDCGKGRIIDYMSENYDMIVKYNGGANSGRTVYVNDKKYVFRLVPSGILWPHTICILAQGMVIDPFVLVGELSKLEQEGIQLKDRLFISDLAHVVFPYHQMVDENRENQSSNKLGTTKKGIGPAYEDKVGRRGIRIVDLFTDELEDLMMRADQYWDTQLDRFDLLNKLTDIRFKLKPFIANTSSLINIALKHNQKVLFEGAQGTLLDLDHGTYPYVTSSNTIAGGACTGSGVGPTKINKVLGVTKAYTTRVGKGPFLTEILGDQAEYLRQQGQEYGSVTGRPRRVGWLDLPALKYAIEINGIDALIITKLDVLSGLDEIKICEAYDNQNRLDAKFFPTKNLKAVYSSFIGWKEPLSEVTTWLELPSEARSYVNYIEFVLQVPICAISVGPNRNQMIVLHKEYL